MQLHMDEIPLRSHASRQMSVYLLQTKYTRLRACTWRASLSQFQYVSITTLSKYVCQLCVLYNSYVLMVPVRASNTWTGACVLVLVFFFFDVLLTVHLSIFISVINQLDTQFFFCFTISLFHASTCFDHMCSSSGGQNCITQPLVLSHL